MTVSYHAVLSRKTHNIYTLGHYLGGLFFLLFAYKFFYLEKGSVFLIVVTGFAVLAEGAQALVQAKGKTELVHNIFACSMALDMLVVLIAAPIILNTSGPKLLALFIIGIVIFLCIIFSIISKLKYLWISQMVYFFIFYVAMYILIS